MLLSIITALGWIGFLIEDAFRGGTMAKSTYDNIAKPIRKRSAKTGTLVGVRLQSEQIKAIDAWAAKQARP
jgi:hypothetical protein